MWTNADSQRVMKVAATDRVLSLGDRSVLIALLLHVEEYEDADPVAWADKRALGVFTGMAERSVKNCLGRLRKAGYLGEWVYRDQSNGWRQYGTRLGPVALGASDGSISLQDAAMNILEESRERSTGRRRS